MHAQLAQGKSSDWEEAGSDDLVEPRFMSRCVEKVNYQMRQCNQTRTWKTG